jgi:prepilin-type N-terminal cleavage/methylation domain-containing protein
MTAAGFFGVGKSGFTLIEMLVVVMIIGVLSTIAVPQYFKVVERNKTTEAVNLFLAMKKSQDSYYAKYNSFCTGAVAGCAGFDLAMPPLHFFTPSPFAAFGGPGAAPGWTAVLTRNDAAGVYGNYSLTYDVEANASPLLTCSCAQCESDLLPAKN